MVKAYIQIMGVAFVLLTGYAYAHTWEFNGAYQVCFPHDDMWRQQDRSQGTEVQLAYWPQNTGLGLAFSVAQNRWDVNPQTVGATGSRTDTLTGQVDYTSLGVSLLAREKMPENPWFFVTLETGVVYMLCDSQAQITRVTDLSGGMSDTEVFALDDSNGWTGRVAAGLELIPDNVEFPVSVFLKAGYQFDLFVGQLTETRWLDYEQDLKLNGAYIQLGAVMVLP